MSRGVPPEFLELVCSKNDIVDVVSKYITLNRRGGSFWACCPFHNEKTPSFAVKQDGQFYKCFGCGEAGNVINFVSKMENVDFLTATEMLAKQAGLEMPSDRESDELKRQKRERDRLYAIMNAAAEFYQNCLKTYPSSPQALYVKSRQLNDAMIEKFRIGISPNYDDIIKFLLQKGFKPDEMIKAGVVGRSERGNLYDFYGGRVIFPIFNSFGDVVAFSGRSVQAEVEHTKYKNTPQTPIFNKSEILFGYNFVRDLKKQHMLDSIVVVEGHIDVIMCHQAGVTNTIGCMGTAFTPLHAKNLKRLVDNVILCLDGDGAGANATYKAILTLKEAGLNVKVVRLTGAKDPDEYIKKFGKDKFLEFLDNAIDCVDFALQDSAKKYDLSSNAGKSAYVNEALSFISQFSTPAEQEIYLNELQQIVNIPIDALRRSMPEAEIAIKRQEKEIDFADTTKNKYILDSKIIILAAILHKKVKNVDEFVGFFNEDDELSKLYIFLQNRLSAGKDVNASIIYDNFDISAESPIEKVINFNFPEDNLFEKMFLDAVKRVKLFNLEQQKAEYTKLLVSCSTDEERIKYLNKIKEITDSISKERK